MNDHRICKPLGLSAFWEILLAVVPKMQNHHPSFKSYITNGLDHFQPTLGFVFFEKRCITLPCLLLHFQHIIESLFLTAHKTIYS